MDSTISSSGNASFSQSQIYQQKYMKTALQRHCAFFDRDQDGIISMTDTFKSLRILGFNWLFALAGMLFIHITMSYQTSPSWIPSWRMPIYLERINRCRHGSSSEAYDFEGNVVSIPAVQNLLVRFDTERRGGLNAAELVWMIWNLRDSYDFFGWIMSAVWWSALYILVADKRGILSQEAIIAQYDGSLFYMLEAQNRKNA